jgi:hypothetical protein
MHSRKLLVVAAIAVGVIGLLAVALSPSACPADLSLVSLTPSVVLDDDDTAPWLVTVSINNRSSGVLSFDNDDWMSVEARVKNRWVPAKILSNVAGVGRHSRTEVDLLVPFAAQACRLNIKYVPEPLNLRLMHTASRLGLWRHSWYQSLAWHVFPVGWLQPTRIDYTGRSPNWRQMNPEMTFPQTADRSSPDVSP